MAEEQKVQAAIRASCGAEPGIVLYRNQVGNAVYAINGRTWRVPYGLCQGSSDLIGWKSLVVTPDMVGTTLAQFVAIEVKGAKGRVKPEQKLFLALVERSGGLSGVARSEEDARKIIGLL